MRTLMLTVGAVALLERAALADKDVDAIKRVVAAQVAAADGNDRDAFGATLAPDASAMLTVGLVTGRDEVVKAMSCTWSGMESVTSLRSKGVVVGRVGDVAWATVDLSFSSRTIDSPTVVTAERLTELFTRDGTRWVGRALFVSDPRQDQPARWEGETLESDRPAGVAPASAPLAAWLGSPADLRAHLRAGNDVIVLGSATGERGAGKAAAALLGTWKKLAFATDWLRAGGDGKTWTWVAARVSRKVVVKGRPVDEPYWVMAFGVRGAGDWEVVSLHYSQDMPYRDDGICD